MVVVWVLLGIALLALELHTIAFFAAFAALGAFAAALVAAAAPEAYALQIAVALATGVAGIVGVRPFVSRAALHRRGERVAHGVHGGLVGSQALALDRVGGESAPGHVRLAGERWLAVSGDGRPIEPGTTVTVTAVRGTTLTVWALDALGLPDTAFD